MKRILLLLLLLPLILPAQIGISDYEQFLKLPVTVPTIDLSPYITKTGTVPLTADWNVGAFDLTAVDVTATNFRLSGTGTLTSTAGNASFTTALTAATGDGAADPIIRQVLVMFK